MWGSKEVNGDSRGVKGAERGSRGVRGFNMGQVVKRQQGGGQWVGVKEVSIVINRGLEGSRGIKRGQGGFMRESRWVKGGKGGVEGSQEG